MLVCCGGHGWPRAAEPSSLFLISFALRVLCLLLDALFLGNGLRHGVPHMRFTPPLGQLDLVLAFLIALPLLH